MEFWQDFKEPSKEFPPLQCSGNGADGVVIVRGQEDDNITYTPLEQNEIYKERIKPVNERNYVEKKTDDDIVIAYKASLSTIDYINTNCEIKTVDNVNITDVLFSPDKPSDICHVNNLENKLMHQRFLLKTQMLIPEISDDRYLFILSHCDRIRKFIENYDEIKSHITNTMDECVAIIDMLQTQLASIDDEDFKNYLINIKMIDAPKN